jgi:hypothetical protein
MSSPSQRCLTESSATMLPFDDTPDHDPTIDRSCVVYLWLLTIDFPIELTIPSKESVGFGDLISQSASCEKVRNERYPTIAVTVD